MKIMTYDLQQCKNTGNWWIMSQEEGGHRQIERTLSAKLTVVEAHRYMEAYIQVIAEANEEIKNG